MAILVGFVAGAILIYYFIQKAKMREMEMLNKAYIFAACNIGGICFSRILFGQVISMNRYILSSAFLPVFVCFLVRENKFLDRFKFKILLSSLGVYWLLFLYHGVLNTWISFLPVTCLLLVFYFYIQRKLDKYPWSLYVVYGLLCLLQVYLFYLFNQGLWIG